MRLALSLMVAASAGACTLLNDDAFVSYQGRYDGYACSDLSTRYMAAAQREKELVEIMDKASRDPVGPAINALVYSSPLAVQQGDLRRLEEAAVRGNCNLQTGKLNP